MESGETGIRGSCDRGPSCKEEELNTGAAVSILYAGQFSHLPLQDTRTKPKTYTGERAFQKGQIMVRAEKDAVTEELSLLVVDAVARKGLAVPHSDRMGIYKSHQCEQRGKQEIGKASSQVS